MFVREQVGDASEDRDFVADAVAGGLAAAGGGGRAAAASFSLSRDLRMARAMRSVVAKGRLEGGERRGKRREEEDRKRAAKLKRSDSESASDSLNTQSARSGHARVSVGVVRVCAPACPGPGEDAIGQVAYDSIMRDSITHMT